MKKILYILIPLGLVLVIYFFIKQNKTPSVSAPTSRLLNEELKNSNSSSGVTVETQLKGKYRLYKPGVLEEDLEKKRTLYFYANWCPVCRPVDQEFNERESEIPENIVIIRVNYNDSDTDNEERELARKYGITYQHTFVQVDQNGEEIKKWNGGGLSELLENIN